MNKHQEILLGVAREMIIREGDLLLDQILEEENNKIWHNISKQRYDGSGWCENCTCNFCNKHKLITVHANQKENYI